MVLRQHLALGAWSWERALDEQGPLSFAIERSNEEAIGLFRLLLGFAPGGPTDAYARLFANHLQTKYGQPVVVVNKLGAATIVGTQIVAKAPPDG